MEYGNGKENKGRELKMGGSVVLQYRNGMKPGDRIRTTQRYRKLYPNSRLLLGNIKNLCRGTEVAVWFDGFRSRRQIDERFIELVQPTA